MSLELSSIAFNVETKELDVAVQKLGDLQKAVTNLNKPIASTTLATEKLAQAQAKTAKEQAKAEEAANKAALAQAKLEKTTTSNAAAQVKLAKSTADSTDKVSVLQQKLENTYKDLSQGFTKGESSVLNYARTLGVAEDALKPIQDQLKLIGKLSSDPFDSAIGSIRSVTKEFEMMNHRTELASKGIILTAKQLKEYSRVADEVAAKIQSAGFDPTEGKGLSDYTKGVERLQSKYLGLASSVSDARQLEQQHQQSLKDSGKAINYLEREMLRAENALAGLNEKMLISSSNRLLRFKEGLAASGMASDEAARRYQAYAKVLADTDAKRSAQSKNSRDDELKYLARATSVQLGDIGVSLAGGQNPFTVMIQQGDQLRAVLNQVGGDAKEMQSAMSTAFKQIVVGFVDVGKALGTFVVGAFKDSAISITKFTGEVTGLALAYDYLRYQMILASTDTDKFVSTLGKFGSTVLNSIGAVTIPMIATGLAGLAIAAVTAAVALKQLITEESNFSKVLNLNGAALGINRDAAYTLATTYAGARGDINGYVAAMTEAAKAGNISASSLKTVTDSAVYMKSVAGVAIEDTVKQFSELAKDPVKALEKLALNIGTIDIETIKHIRSLKEQGKEAEATEKAIEAYGKGLTKAAAGIKTDMGYLESFFKTIGSAASSMWDKILNVGREGTLQQQIDAAKEKIRSLSAGEGVFILSDRNVTLGIEKARLEGLEKQLAAQDALNASKVKNTALLKSDSDVNALMDQFVEKSDKKKKAIQEVNATFNTAIELAKKYKKDTTELEANRVKALAGVEEKFKEKSIKREDTAGVAAMWEKVSSAVNKANQSYDEVVNGVQVYTNAQKIMIDLLDDPAFLKQPETLQKEALARLAVAHATEQQTQEVKDLWETEKRRILSTFQSEAEVDALRIAREQRGDSEIINAQNKLQLLDEELADMLLQKAIYGELTVEQKKQLEYAKIQKEYKAEELRITKLLADPKNGIDEKAAEYLRNQNYEAAAKKRQNIDQAIILENNKYEYEQRVQLAAGISSSIETALFEGGQAGSKKLREVIEAELRKPITLFIQAFVQDIFGLNGAGDTMNKAASAFDKVLSFVNGGYASGLTKTGTSVVGSLVNNEVGAKLGLSYYDGTKYTTTGLGDTLGKTAGQVGGAMTAYGIQKGLSGGYKTGESGVVDALTAIGGFFDPTGGLIAGTIGAAVNRAFGRKLTETGIEGTFGGSQGFTGNQYSFEKGGWFRSDRTKTSALDSGIQEGLAGQFNVLRAGIALMSTSLGLGTKSIEDFTYKFKLNLMGLSEADATKKIQEEFDKVGIAIADTIPELKEYQKQGETNLDTLTRLSTSLGTVNSTFELLGFKLEDLSLAGANAADKIIAAYGSLEAFNTKMQAYYDAFYTEDEKKAKVLSGVAAALKAAGVDVGDVSTLTRDGFRKIVDELVRTKGAADPAVVALLSVAPAFASVTDAAKSAADKAKEIEEKNKKIADERLSLEDKLLTAQGNTAELRKRELERLDPSNRALQSRIWAIEDETKAAEAAAQAKQKAEDAAKQAQAATDNAMKAFDQKVKEFFDKFTSSVADVASVLNSVSSSISDFIASLITQVKGNAGLIQVRQEFERNLSKAKSGDRDALSNITGSAGSLIESIRSNATTAAEAALGQARVVQQLLKLPSQVRPEDLIVSAIEKQAYLLSNSITKDFTALDTNVDGLLTFDELKAAGLASDGQIGNVIAALDANADGNISAMEAMTATLSARFSAIDVNVSGAIDYNEFRNTFAGLGSESTLRSIFSELDVNGDGTISRLEAIKGTSADTADNTYGLDKLSRIKDVVNALNWGTSEFDAASLKALATVASQQKWTAKDISDALGRFTAEEITSFFNQYGYQIGTGTIGSGIPTGTATGSGSTATGARPSFIIGGTSTSSNGTSSVVTNSKLGNTYYGAGGTAIYDPYYVDRFDSINSYVNTLDWGAGKDESIASLVANAQQYGVSANEIAIATGYSRDDIIALTGGRIPAFANGGFHAGGLRLVGEQGPEVELTGPSRIISNNKLSSMLNQDSSEVVAAINELNSNVNLLRYEMQATAVNTGKTERILNRVTNYGESMQVTTTV